MNMPDWYLNYNMKKDQLYYLRNMQAMGKEIADKAKQLGNEGSQFEQDEYVSEVRELISNTISYFEKRKQHSDRYPQMKYSIPLKKIGRFSELLDDLVEMYQKNILYNENPKLYDFHRCGQLIEKLGEINNTSNDFDTFFAPVFYLLNPIEISSMMVIFITVLYIINS